MNFNPNPHIQITEFILPLISFKTKSPYYVRLCMNLATMVMQKKINYFFSSYKFLKCRRNIIYNVIFKKDTYT